MNFRSAGSSSPWSTRTMSPTTTSFFGISCALPSRITFTGVSLLTWFRMSNSFSACLSFRNARTVARTIAINIPMDSTAWPVTIANSAAMTRIRMIGSSNSFASCFHQGARFGGCRRFAPCRARLSRTCWEVRPKWWWLQLLFFFIDFANPELRHFQAVRVIYREPLTPWGGALVM